MRRMLLASVVGLALTPGVIVGQAKTLGNTTGNHPNEREVHALARQAHTTEEYSSVAQDYQQLHDDLLNKATEEKAEWARRLQYTTGALAKYPTPADSAKSLCQYYEYKAAQMESLSQRYAGMAASLTQATKR